MNWSVEFLNEALQSKLDSLPKDVIASFLRIVRLIELGGPQNVHEPYVKHLDGPIWEMRLKGRDGIARAAYVTAHARIDHGDLTALLCLQGYRKTDFVKP